MRPHGESAASPHAPHSHTSPHGGSPHPAAAHSSRSPDTGAPPAARRSDWGTIARLLPYLWQYKWRVVAALVFVIGAKTANVGVPLLLKHLVDAMTITPGNPAMVVVVPVALIVAYGLLRLSTSVFTELRELVFAKATQGAARTIALQTFEHQGVAYFHLGFEINKGDHDSEVAAGQPTSGWIGGAIEIFPREYEAARAAKLEARQ